MKKVGGPITNEAILNYIEENTIPNETVLATAVGIAGDFLFVTNKKIVILKKGFATWATGSFGLKAKSHQIATITSIDIAKGLMFCDLEIVSAGSRERYTGGFDASAISQNVFQFEKRYYSEITAIVNEIRNLIDEYRTIATSNSTISIPEQIKKLHELYEQGILTKEEFDEKKKDLLQKM